MPYKVYGGVHPSSFKTTTADRPIKRAMVPKRVVIPLLQHTGSPAEPVVSPGATVRVGDIIARPAGRVSATIHASISGKVTKLEHVPTRVNSRVLSVTIESQGNEDQEFRPKSANDVLGLSRDEILGIIKDAGIVGLGGAAFPTYVKLDPPKTKAIDSVILNGAECEPYITCDHRLMVERPDEIIKGFGVIAGVLGAKNAYIAIENNKMAAIYAMERALEKTRVQIPKIKNHKAPYGANAVTAADTKIVILKARYPQGAEKQVVKAVLGRVVPSGELPMDVGCVVNNVATAFGIYEALYLGKPLIERVVTLTGSCLREPVNVWARIGTILGDLVDYAGGFYKDPAKVVVGGPMMGISQYTMDIPVTKGFNAALFIPQTEVDNSKEGVCIRCGKCARICPMKLVPTALMYRVKKEMFSEADRLGIKDCYECGACAYACPAKIPLLDYMKYGKSKVVKV